MTDTATHATATAGALLDAAEAAFADRSIETVSLRSIMRAAGVNTAAVHYHFGSRQALAEAVLDRVLAPLSRRRLELLEELLSRVAPPGVRDLVAALVRPDFEAVLALRKRNPAGVRLIGTIYIEPSRFAKSLVEAHFAPVARRFLPHLQAALSHLGPEEISWRIRWSLFGLLGALLSDRDLDINEENVERHLARVLAAVTGALRAPASKEPTP